MVGRLMWLSNGLILEPRNFFTRHSGQIRSASLLSQMFRRRHLSRLKRKRLFDCRLFRSLRGRSRSPCPSFPSNGRYFRPEFVE
eukprot:scaffold1007_cov135-Skeletonema_marinoi.AAC.1